MLKSGMFDLAGKATANMVQVAMDIASVEKELNQQVCSPVAIVEQVLAHTLTAGGKRLRPAFLLLSARATGLPFDHSRAISLGACMEMIHMATLIHDDVIDESPTRRGRPTAASQFGNTPSILSGDVLLAKAMTILADDGDIEIIRTASRMVVEMAEGEAREVEIHGNFDLTLDEHFEVLRMKTAAFVECCCALGAMTAKADATAVQALSQYGHHLGIAFQIVDDLLDYRGNPAQTGKRLGNDFVEGCATLPLILLRELLSAEEQALLRASFGTPAAAGVIESVVHWMGSRGVFDRAETQAREHLTLAMNALNHLPRSSHRALLEAAGQYVISRTG